jgi:hypothetical protein
LPRDQPAGQLERRREQDVRPHAADVAGDVAAQVQAVLHDPVGVVGEAHVVDADDRGARHLLLLA